MRSTNSQISRVSVSLLLAVCSLQFGCNDSGDGNPTDGKPNTDDGFETPWPGSNGSSSDGAGGTSGSDSGARARGAPNTAAGNPTGDAAQRAIEEADIIQVDGNRLFALSRLSGLNVVDLSNPGALRLLGRYPDTNNAEPFELYVRDGVALVMFSGWGKYERATEGDGYLWVQTSEVIALDVKDPAQIKQLGTFEIPGAISDSRIVGDVLYVVGYEDGYCWNCTENQARTVVASLDVSDVQNIRKVDQLAYNDDDNSWGWNRRSISVTAERMYVAGPEYGNNGPVGSSIQVIDISDAGGDLVEGAVVQAAGQVSSRWQMDEFEGVLRVISQPPQWNLNDPPSVQTFTVVSSNEVTPLGKTKLVLPRPEQLQSVRFDGPRAYAITAERTDPLFTIDLSDPATPVQRGELEIPGFVYHMEPRGDRVIGLGFDQGAPEGSITVSIFDVSDLANPTMLDRVNFGGDWAQLPEDQDRIHKVFRVLDEQGLILVPHSGWQNTDSNKLDGCYGRYSSGVQLMDFTRDSLTLRGAVPSRGEARRALLHDGRLLTVSDQQVESYVIDDRDAPKLSASLALARNVTRALALSGGVVARMSTDWWDNTLTMDFVASADAEIPASGLAELNLNDALNVTDGCKGSAWVQDAYADGSRVMVLYQHDSWDGIGENQSRAGLLIIDAADPTEPKVLSNTDWAINGNSYRYSGYYALGLPISDSAVARVPGALAMLEARYVQDKADGSGHEVFSMRVVDTTDVAHPKVSVLDLPRPAGDSGYAGLQAADDTIVTSHSEPLGGASGAVRFYLDRIDLSNPSAPKQLPPVNMPGVVLHYDAALARALTVDLSRTDVEGLSWEACSKRFATTDFEDDNYNDTIDRGICHGYQQTLRLVKVSATSAVIEASHKIDETQALRRLVAGDERLFGTLGRGNNGYYGRGGRGIAIADCFGPCGFYGGVAADPEELLVLSGLADGKLDIGTLGLEPSDDPWYGWWGAADMVAAGKRVLVTSQSDLAIIDASDPTHPVLERTEPLVGYVQSIDVTSKSAVLSLGEHGCQVVDF